MNYKIIKYNIGFVTLLLLFGLIKEIPQSPAIISMTNHKIIALGFNNNIPKIAL